MSGILRYYLLPECDERGFPLDWEYCRLCGGSGGTEVNGVFMPRDCPTCDGHGSLKAAALDCRAQFASHKADNEQGYVMRCEDCGHPMSEGTWEGVWASGPNDAQQCLDVALRQLCDGEEPWVQSSLYTEEGERTPWIHYSPCDKGCRHGLVQGRDLIDIDHGGEASWRDVDVRTLDRPCMLEPQYLAVLCLRCWAAR